MRVRVYKVGSSINGINDPGGVMGQLTLQTTSDTLLADKSGENSVKGTKDVISNDPLFTECHVRFSAVPVKAFYDDE